MRDRKKRNIIIGSLCCLLVFMATGYAFLKQVLNINGTASLTGDWKIRISDISVHEVVGTASNIEDKLSYTDTEATFGGNLVKPGDKIVYKVTVVNEGSIDAVLSIDSTTSAHKDIKFTNTLTSGEILYGSGSTNGTTKLSQKEFYVTAEFSESATDIISGEISEYKIELTYTQYDGNNSTELPEVDTDSSCFRINAEGTITDYDESCGTYKTIPKEIDGITVKKLGTGSFLNINVQAYQNTETNEIIALFTTDQAYEDFLKSDLGSQMKTMIGNGVTYYIEEDLSDEEYNNILDSIKEYTPIHTGYYEGENFYNYGKPFVEVLDVSLATELIELESNALFNWRDIEGEVCATNPLKRVELGQDSSIQSLGAYNFWCVNMDEMVFPNSVIETAYTNNMHGENFGNSYINNFTTSSNSLDVSYPYSGLTVENLIVYLGDSEFAYLSGFKAVTNVTIGEGITGLNIPDGAKKVVLPSTIQSISNVRGMTDFSGEIIFMHKVKPEFYGDTSWYDSSLVTVSYPNID